MVSYAYPGLFYEHESVHFIIVNADATVTSVSNSAPSISGDTFLITEEEMKQEAFELTESLCSEDNITFGLLESAHVKFDIYNISDIPNLSSEEIVIYLYFNGDSDTLFKVGTYVVKEDKYSPDRAFREINAYDILNYLWNYDITSWYDDYFKTNTTTTVKDARDDLFTWLGTEIDDYSVEQETTTLVNDDYVFGDEIESDVVTFEFFMSKLLEVNGVFGHIGRDGKFHYVKLADYTEQQKRTFTDEITFSPVKYEDYKTWRIEQVYVYDGKNKKLTSRGSSSKKSPNRYKVVDNFVFNNTLKLTGWKAALKSAATNLRNTIVDIKYTPIELTAIGSLVYEVGDRINYVHIIINDDDTHERYECYTYMLERRFTGIQGFKDVISAKGDKKQPKYQVNNDSWHPGDSGDTATSGSGTGGVADLNDEQMQKFVQIIRNIGFRLLPEPSGVSVEYNRSTGNVEIKWSDPDDIINYKPVPCEWAGTVLVRKENEVPLHRFGGDYGGEVLVDNTTRDAYKTNAYIDNTVQPNKRYYYGIFPYHVALDDADHPIKHYRFTKVISVDTEDILVAPTILYAECDEGTEVVITYLLPELTNSTYSYVKLAYKKDSIPKSLTDADGVIDITNNPIEPMLHSGQYTVTGLDELSEYYFVIFVENSNGTKADSEPASCTTKEDLGTDFEYTGAIQTFTAPKTGVYSVETWGAQGGNATDGTNTARGGYGAYAYGEVLLQQGDVLYVNVGGQNGYGGGGTNT